MMELDCQGTAGDQGHGEVCVLPTLLSIYGTLVISPFCSGTLSQENEKIDPSFMLQGRLTAVLCTAGTYRINKVYFTGEPLWA